MSTEPNRPDDPYSRADYRRMVAWEARIERESGFLLRILDKAPDKSVVDLGCGTGEHVAFFAQHGCRAVGLDRSESMLAAAREHESRGHGRFVEGDVLHSADALAEEAPFGMGLCLGNMLPHLRDDADLDRFAHQVRKLLLPGGHFLLQILNYGRLIEGGIRNLPLNFREGDGDEEVVFVRLMKHVGDGRVLFFPTTLTLDADSEEPVAVRATRRVELRAWSPQDLRRSFELADMHVYFFGDMQGKAFDATASNDLVVVAVREPG